MDFERYRFEKSLSPAFNIVRYVFYTHSSNRARLIKLRDDINDSFDPVLYKDYDLVTKSYTSSKDMRCVARHLLCNDDPMIDDCGLFKFPEYKYPTTRWTLDIQYGNWIHRIHDIHRIEFPSFMCNVDTEYFVVDAKVRLDACGHSQMWHTIINKPEYEGIKLVYCEIKANPEHYCINTDESYDIIPYKYFVQLTIPSIDIYLDESASSKQYLECIANCSSEFINSRIAYSCGMGSYSTYIENEEALLDYLNSAIRMIGLAYINNRDWYYTIPIEPEELVIQTSVKKAKKLLYRAAAIAHSSAEPVCPAITIREFISNDTGLNWFDRANMNEEEYANWLKIQNAKLGQNAIYGSAMHRATFDAYKKIAEALSETNNHPTSNEDKDIRMTAFRNLMQETFHDRKARIIALKNSIDFDSISVSSEPLVNKKRKGRRS